MATVDSRFRETRSDLSISTLNLTAKHLAHGLLISTNQRKSGGKKRGNMPILYHKRSWRLFEAASCPADCIIPTADGQAYDLFPQFHRFYDKLVIAELQGINCGPPSYHPGATPIPDLQQTNLQPGWHGCRHAHHLLVAGILALRHGRSHVVAASYSRLSTPTRTSP